MEEQILYKDIIEYLTEELKHKPFNTNDTSYTKWVKNNENLKLLCKTFPVTEKEAFINNVNDTNVKKDNKKNVTTDNKDYTDMILQQHDYPCEFKLLQLITEDKDHLVKLETNQNIIRQDKKEQEHNSVNEEKMYLYHYNLIANTKINACYIDGPFVNKGDEKLFIVAKGPSQGNQYDFWKLILDNNISQIILLSKTNKNDSNMKLEQYYPNTLYHDENNEKQLTIKSPNNDGNKIHITNITTYDIIKKHLYLTELMVNKTHKINHLHVLSWDEYSIPPNQEGYEMLIFIIEQLKMFREDKNNKNSGPILIHSNKGIGRCGTFIAIYNIIRCLDKLKKLKENGNSDIIPQLNVFNVVRKLREQRYGMVSSAKQYKFIYKMCLEWIKKNYNRKAQKI